MKNNVTVFGVAKYILEKKSAMTAMKLQKLIYYCQAWSLVWSEQELFQEPIEAWANGPVIRELYEAHRGKYKLFPESIKGNLNILTQDQKENIDLVLEYYGDKSPQWLSDLTHMEDPWQEARRGLSDMDRSNQEISLASMVEYYSSL